jgi:biotin-dependent carboxylase-like uncharacterized protein
MIRIINPAWLSIVVDGGRFGYADVGVPPSSALDGFAYLALQALLGNPAGSPAFEVMGFEFSIEARVEVSCAITGARVLATLDGSPLVPWTVFRMKTGSVLRVSKVVDGFRYYVGFAGTMDLPRAIDSYSTNIECKFGGFRGRPLVKGDLLPMQDCRVATESRYPEERIPPMGPSHVLRVLDGPEVGCFTDDSLRKLCDLAENQWYTVSPKSNRIGIRLDGEPLVFREGVEKSIVSEGILPGTIQVPGDGMPIIQLYERTIGGYARPGLVARADLDKLAHLRPKDEVLFEHITHDEAAALWREREIRITFLDTL